MLDRHALDVWTRTHHGVWTQATVISFIAKKVDEMEAFGCEVFSIIAIMNECKIRHTPDVSITTMRRWWTTYLEWGELPTVVKKKKQQLKKKMHAMGNKAAIDENELLILKQIVDDNPNLYLDEI